MMVLRPLALVCRLPRARALTSTLFAAALLAPAVVVTCAVPASAADELRIQGATTFYERVLASNLARVEAMTGTKIAVVPNKSIWGLIAVLEQRADLAMISADLAGEIEVARRTAPDLPYEDLKIYEVAESRIAFTVHPSNTVKSLTSAQISALLLGEITNWREVGGADMPVRIVATQDGGGTVVAVRSQLLAGRPISAPNAVRPESARHVIQVVAQEPGALGIAQLGLVIKAGLPEITTEKPVVQTLSFVALGPATGTLEAVIDAARTIAAENPL